MMKVWALLTVCVMSALMESEAKHCFSLQESECKAAHEKCHFNDGVCFGKPGTCNQRYGGGSVPTEEECKDDVACIFMDETCKETYAVGDVKRIKSISKALLKEVKTVHLDCQTQKMVQSILQNSRHPTLTCNQTDVSIPEIHTSELERLPEGYKDLKWIF